MTSTVSTKAGKISLPEGTKVPNHIALILDGNRRWARARGLQPWEGHKAGYEAVIKLARAARDMGVHTFTVWAWSTENWDRPEMEVGEIFSLFRRALTEMGKELISEKVRFVHLGRKDRIPADVAAGIRDLEEKTKQFSEHTFNLAVDYGGRDEILRATKKMILAGSKEDNFEQMVEQLDEKRFEQYLDTGDQPYPYVDLFIRTSGEQRTSGLLPWQMTYAEMYWEVDHLPDFSPEKLVGAILDYSCRRRRFGGNDKEEHLGFDPKLVAKLEIDMQRQIGEGQRFTDLVVEYVRQQYGLSKELAKEGGVSLAKALVYRKQEDWQKAREALKGLYEVVKKNVGLAMEPELVAKIEVGTWQNRGDEVSIRKLLAEKFRFSDFQASKSARLARLANTEVGLGNWDKARELMEKYYQALKERVA